METDRQKIERIWKQTSIPVAFRPAAQGAKCMVKFPYRTDSKDWLKKGRRSRPKWNPTKKCWEIPMAWFNDFVERAMKEWGQIYIIQPYKRAEKCAPACMNATYHECECSCMGVNHGKGQHGNWMVVNDAFAVKYGQSELACRHVSYKKPS